ncbi:30S ribosomal protein S11 [Nematostella vectensis]|uniref:30S ribosomal protein S11 n=1 Tax=Nematostella vectensis TaxID=45351 RepID=UPI00138FA2EC|nr:30S ribosomal protein S11 [Nematostella vectensis]
MAAGGRACLRRISSLLPSPLAGQHQKAVCRSWSVIQLLRYSATTQRSLATKARPQIYSSDDAKFSQKPIIHVNATYNNTLLTLTDHKGNTLAWSSAGSEGYKNSKRGSSVAAQQAALSLVKKATDFGVSNVRVKVKGVGQGKQSSLRALQTGGLKVVSITDVTPIPHNGCRPKKARRI